MSTLIPNKFNIVTSLVNKTWEVLGFTTTNIAVVHLIDPETGSIIDTWNPNFPSFAPLSVRDGIVAGKRYMIQPLTTVTSSDFYSFTSGDTPKGLVTLIPSVLNARQADETLTWNQLGWSAVNVDIVYRYDPNSIIPVAAYDPAFPQFAPSDFLGIVAGLAYQVQPKISLNVTSGFYKYASAALDRLPITSVMLTSFDEFGYDTEPVLATTSFGGSKTLNGIYDEVKRNRLVQKTDFVYMIEEDIVGDPLDAKIPGLAYGGGEAIMWVNWFTEGTAAYGDNGMYNPTTIKPMLQETTYDSIYDPLTPGVIKWRVGSYDPTNITKIPATLKGSGTMNDQSFINGALALQQGTYSNGNSIKVGIVPVVIALRPIVAGTVTETNYQNWRGYITFTNETDFKDFTIEYTNYVKHYIDLCYDNPTRINLSTVYVGSEFEAIMLADYSAADYRINMDLYPGEIQNSQGITDAKTFNSSLIGGSFPASNGLPFRQGVKKAFIKVLGDLATYVKSKFPAATVTYASNWTDYNHCDEMWLHPDIDGIGIDWYFPTVDIHTNDIPTLTQHLFTGGEGDAYKYTNLDYNSGNRQDRLVTTDGVGKSLNSTAPITDPSYLAGPKRLAAYRNHLLTLDPGFNKPFMATELGISSCNGAAVEPNVFPVVLSGTLSQANAVIGALPPTHNMKSFWQKMIEFNLLIANAIGPYGSTYEMDEDHQYNYLKGVIDAMVANGITKHVIYTLDARPSGMFGAVIFNTSAVPQAQDEIYTYDTPVFPLNLAINGKKAGGWAAGDLLTRITPTLGNSEIIPESDATMSFKSFVNVDVTDPEWGYNSGYIVPGVGTLVAAPVDTLTGAINPNGTESTGVSGRFAYFRTMGTLNTTLTSVSACNDTYTPNALTIQKVPMRINFEAKGTGTIKVVVYGGGSSSELVEIATRTFVLTSSYQVFGWSLNPAYPQQEYVVGILVNGAGTTGNVTAFFKKNFCILLDQAGMNLVDGFYRIRADETSLLGNVETEWYGWNDKTNQPRKKYLQASAYSKMTLSTDATQLAVEYVRDSYNSSPKNIFPAIYTKYGYVVSATTGGITAGNGAVNNNIAVEPSTSYVISGLFTGAGSGATSALSTAVNPIRIVWLNSSNNPIGGIEYPTNSNTDLPTKYTRPFYQITSPAGAVKLAIQVVLVPNPSALPDTPQADANDSFTVYANCQIEKGVVGGCGEYGKTLPTDDDARSYIGEERLKISGISVFVNGALHEYCNVEDETVTDPDIAPNPAYISPVFPKQVAIRKLSPLPAGTKTVEIVSSGGGRYDPADPNVRRTGTFLRAVYVNTPLLTPLP